MRNTLKSHTLQPDEVQYFVEGTPPDALKAPCPNTLTLSLASSSLSPFSSPTSSQAERKLETLLVFFANVEKANTGRLIWWPFSLRALFESHVVSRDMHLISKVGGVTAGN